MFYLNGRINIPFVDGLYVQSVFNGATLKGNTFMMRDFRVGYDLDLVALDIEYTAAIAAWHLNLLI